jgi:hypothetical protein
MKKVMGLLEERAQELESESKQQKFCSTAWRRTRKKAYTNPNKEPRPQGWRVPMQSQ